MRALLFATVVLAGCYDPSYQDLACGPAGECPDDFVCASNVCVRDPSALDAATVDGAAGDGAVSDGAQVDAAVDAVAPVHDAAVDAIPPCPSGTTTSPNDPTRCFRFVNAARTWANARTACMATGGALADVRNVQENLALIELVGANAAVWLGGTDVATEGAWLWTDGTPFSFNAWGESEPSGGLLENCARFAGPNSEGLAVGDWADQVCSQQYPSICVEAP